MKRHLWIMTAGAIVFYLLFGMGTLQTTASTNYQETSESEVSSDEAKLYAKKYTVSGNTITVKAENGQDIGSALNKALEAASELADATGQIITVKVPAGSYLQSKTAHIYSNTTLDLTGVTLTSTGDTSFNMITTGTSGAYKNQVYYNSSSACSGYNGFKNITILGGKLVSSKKKNTSTIVRLFHAKNVTIDGMILKGGGCTHQMEVAAINGFSVKNCTFQDHGKKKSDTKNHTNQEALQLDMPCSEELYPGIYEDGTPMKNVSITGCVFKNVARGVGTHTMLKGSYHENINVSNNTFINVVEECIIAVNYYKCEIKNNTITNCGGGILVQNYKSASESIYTTTLTGTKSFHKKFRHNLKTVVSGNKISLRYNKTCMAQVGIKVCGYKQKSAMIGGDGMTLSAGNYYISGVTVTKNTIVTSGRGIHFLDARNCTASKNKITGKHFSSKDPDRKYWDGILVEQGSKNIAIKKNKISGMPRAGLMVHSSSSVRSISGNTISKCKKYGIALDSNATITKSISKNKISNIGKYGILIQDGATVRVSIVSNTIKNAKRCGIDICSVRNHLAIRDNKIRGGSTASIYIEPNSTKYGIVIRANTLTGNKKGAGIVVRKADVSILDNKISKVTYGIDIDADSLYDISGNAIKNASKQDILKEGEEETEESKEETETSGAGKIKIILN